MGQIIAFPAKQRVETSPFAIPARHGAAPEQPEVVAALLLAMEDAPLTPAFAFGATDIITGRPFVGVRLDGVALRVTVQDARLAAAALVAEQAFVGCMANARALTLAADAAENAFLRKGIA